MKRIATIIKDNAQLDCYSNGIIFPTAVLGPIARIELHHDKFLIVTYNGCSIWADEIRREE